MPPLVLAKYIKSNIAMKNLNVDTEFSDMEQDALIEIFNTSLGRAAAALNRLIHDDVTLEIPKVDVLAHEDVNQTLIADTDNAVTAIRQGYEGDFAGSAYLMFPQAQSLNLVRSLLSSPVPLGDLTDLEQEALIEVGNIILNACFGTVSNLLNLDVDISIPELQQGHLNEIFQDQKNHWSLLLPIKFALLNRDIKGSVSFIMDVESIQQFNDAVQRYLTTHVH